MKIVFLNSGVPDYGCDALYIGMRRLGHEVEDRPRKRSLHDANASYRFGAEVCGDFGISVVDKPDLTFVDLNWKAPIPQPCMVYDARDVGGKGINEYFYRESFLYFIREYKERYKNFAKARPLPFSLVQCNDSFGTPASKRDIDVSCTIFPHPFVPARTKVINIIKGMKDIKTSVGFRSLPEYRDVLRRSKISINVVGNGNTYRYWDIVHHGAVLCSHHPDIVIPNNFGQEVIFFDLTKLNELEEKLRHYLSDPFLLDWMQAQAWGRLIKFHTAKARASYALEEVRKYYATL